MGEDRISGRSASQLRPRGPNKRRYAAPSGLMLTAVSSIVRPRTAGGGPSSGCTKGSGGWIHSNPYRVSGKERKNGEATAIGCTAEPMSWIKPGRVKGRERAPP